MWTLSNTFLRCHAPYWEINHHKLNSTINFLLCVEIGPTFALQQTEHLVPFLRACTKWLLVSPGLSPTPLSTWQMTPTGPLFVRFYILDVHWNFLIKTGQSNRQTYTVDEDLCTYTWFLLCSVFMTEIFCVYCQICTEAEEKLGVSVLVSTICMLLFP